MKFSSVIALSLVVASVEGLSTSYFQSMAGARGTAAGPRSYAPTGQKPKVVVNNMGSSYLNNVNKASTPSYSSYSSSASPVTAAPAVSAASNNGSYLGNLAGSSKVASIPRGKFSAFSGKKPKVVVNSMGSSYLNKVSGAASVVSSSTSTSTAPSVGSYLSNLSGSSSSVVSAPRGRFSAFSGKKPKVVVNNMGSSYLNKVSGASTAATSSTSVSAGPASYLSNLSGAAVGSAPRARFSAFSGKKPKVVVHGMGSSYLNKLRDSSPVTSSVAPASGSTSYLGNLGGATVATIPRGRFSAFTGKKPKAVVNNMGSSYLNGIRNASPVPSYSAAPSTTSQSVSSAPRGKYSPFSGKKPKAVINNMGSSYLNKVGRGSAAASSYSAPVSAAPVVKAAPTTGSYLGNLNGASSFKTSSPRGSFSPVGKKPKAVINNMGSSYLTTVNSGKGLSSFAGYSAPAPAQTFSNWEPAPAASKSSWTPYQPLTKSYSFAGAAAAASAPVVEAPKATGSYLESLGGGRRW